MDWRKKVAGKLAFLCVANFTEAETTVKVNGPNYAKRNKNACCSNTGMAITIDIGEWNDLHPLNKEDVGKRLALAAEKFLMVTVKSFIQVRFTNR
jgi:sialate O-acetylesterase